MAFGDSITAGEVTVPSSSGLTSSKLVLVPSAAYPTVLERLLRTRYPAHNNDIIVVNQGLSGEKAATARPRFQAALTSIRPDVVLILHGANDIPGGADGAASTAAFEVRMMVAEARTRGARVFLATPVPGKPGFRVIDPFLLRDYADRMRAVASQEGAVLVDLYAAMLPEASRYIGVDGLHPNEAGYTRMAELFAEAIQRELEVR
jgi:lysophospholipase L1-like esterase